MRLFRYFFGDNSRDASGKTDETKGLLASAKKENSNDPRDTVIVHVENKPREEVVPTIAKRPKPLYFITPNGRRSNRLPCDIVTHIMSFLCGNGFESLTADTLFTRVHPLDVAIDGTWLARSRLGYGDETDDQNGPAPSKLLRQNKEWLESLRDAKHAHQFLAFLNKERLERSLTSQAEGDSLCFRYYRFYLSHPIALTAIDLTKNYTDYQQILPSDWLRKRYIGTSLLILFCWTLCSPLIWAALNESRNIFFSTNPLCLSLPCAYTESAALSCFQLILNTTIGCNNTDAFCPTRLFPDLCAWQQYLDSSRPDLLCYTCGNHEAQIMGAICVILFFSVSGILPIFCLLHPNRKIYCPVIPHDMQKHLPGFIRFFAEKKPPILIGPPTEAVALA